MLASRHIKREKGSLPVDVRPSKTSLLKLPVIAPNAGCCGGFVLLSTKGILVRYFQDGKNKVNWKFENVIYDLTFAPFSVL